MELVMRLRLWPHYILISCVEVVCSMELRQLLLDEHV